MGKLIDLTGIKFEQWTVVGRSKEKKRGHKLPAYWECVCSCGVKKSVNGKSLRNGGSTNCGCVKNIPGRPPTLNKYKRNPNMVEGVLTNTRKTFIIDIDDFEKVKQYTWYENKYGYVETAKYQKGKHKRVFLHRLIMGVNDVNWLDVIIDHISRNKLDNRKSNLRIVSNTQNQFNRGLRSDNESGITGVSFDKRDNVWKACINYMKKRICLGSYTTKDEAAKARRDAEKIYFK